MRTDAQIDANRLINWISHIHTSALNGFADEDDLRMLSSIEAKDIRLLVQLVRKAEQDDRSEIPVKTRDSEKDLRKLIRKIFRNMNKAKR